MKVLQTVALVMATMTTGLMAGVFGLYAHAIMPGLARTDDRTFVGAFQQIDKAIERPRFVPVVAGALVFTALAVVLHLPDDARPVLPWLVAALALYLVALAITAAINVPRNTEIKAAGDPDQIADLAAVRERFDEHRWNTWNAVRALASTTAFGLLAWALIVHGRALHA
jgi:uncharacterized membrane protein